jgi:hypothetical protein
MVVVKWYSVGYVTMVVVKDPVVSVVLKDPVVSVVGDGLVLVPDPVVSVVGDRLVLVEDVVVGPSDTVETVSPTAEAML